MDQSEQSVPQGEMILYGGRLHWAYFLRPVMFTTLALALFNLGETFAGLAVLILAGLFWAAHALSASSTRLLITSRRVIVQTGYLWRTSLVLPLDEVDRVQVQTDTMGRLLGYGTIVVDGRDGSRAAVGCVARAGDFGAALHGRLGVA